MLEFDFASGISQGRITTGATPEVAVGDGAEMCDHELPRSHLRVGPLGLENASEETGDR